MKLTISDIDIDKLPPAQRKALLEARGLMITLLIAEAKEKGIDLKLASDIERGRE